MPLRAKTTRLITGLTGVVLTIVAVFVPVAYFLISQQYLSGSLDAEAEINARIISRIIGENPTMWEFEQVRIEEFLSRRPSKYHAEVRRVLNSQGELVAEIADRLPSPVMMRSVPLFDSGREVGRIEIAASLRPLVIRTAILFLGMLPFAAALFLAVYLLPIREIRRSEAELRRERDTAQRYLDAAGVLFLVVGADEKVRTINRKGCAILGCDEPGLLGRNWFEAAVPEKDRDAARGRFREAASGAVQDLADFESQVVRKDGSERTISWHLISLAPSGEGVLYSGEDITDRKKLEAQLRQSQKMEAVGRLAGGVAHDFNNILTAVIGYATLLTMDLDEADPRRHNAEQILASADRAAHLTRGLLAYSRKQNYLPKPLDVNQAVRNVEKLLRRMIGEDIELRLALAPGPMTVFADQGQLDQVLMNLATNARDAMPKGGTLTIETGISTDRPPGDGTGGSGRQQHAVVTVSDTGHGMSRETLERIFDPFFTTKDVGKGTGLGLAIVYGIMQQHQGQVTVYSEEGKGTSFKLSFPLVERPAEMLNAAALPAPVRGTETVLLAEDDPAVRAMTTAALRSFGYTVHEARDGDEAVRMFADHRHEIHLVVLDVIMPRKNGKAAHEEIRKLRPDIKTLFTSGYTADFIGSNGMMDGNIPFLQKPASPVQMLAKVREILDGSHGSAD